MRRPVSDGEGSDEDRDWAGVDEDEGIDNERSEALNKRLPLMSAEQRVRFELFGSTVCKIPPKWCSEVLYRSLPQNSVQANSALVASFAVKLFIADLVETAKRLSNNTRPLTPDLIIIAYNEMESHGKIPGKGPGVKLRQFR
jgi:hypothetical protein